MFYFLNHKQIIILWWLNQRKLKCFKILKQFFVENLAKNVSYQIDMFPQLVHILYLNIFYCKRLSIPPELQTDVAIFCRFTNDIFTTQL
jgi:hypothetical protein